MQGSFSFLLLRKLAKLKPETFYCVFGRFILSFAIDKEKRYPKRDVRKEIAQKEVAQKSSFFEEILKNINF